MPLVSWETQPQNVYRHQWRIGDMLIFDNLGPCIACCPMIWRAEANSIALR
jgi:hypothetical protein